jgi:hypothetical protein
MQTNRVGDLLLEIVPPLYYHGHISPKIFLCSERSSSEQYSNTHFLMWQLRSQEIGVAFFQGFPFLSIYVSLLLISKEVWNF